MKLITRRILFCFCLVLFLISSPMVILYAFGFRYDFTQKKLMQTGIIYLTPNIQNDIKILINDKEELDRISIKGIFKKDFVLHNLIPKTYNIKVNKENYHQWEKNLVVLPGLITYATPLLLPVHPDTNLIFTDINIPVWTISDKFNKIFYLKSNDQEISANIYNFSKKTLISESIPVSDNQLKNISIAVENSKILSASDGKKIGIILNQDATADRIILFNSTEKNILPIADFISNNKIIDERWSDSSRFFLYLNAKNELNSYDTATGKENKILENISGFALKEENIYYLDRNNLFFYQTSLNNPLEKRQVSYIPMTIAPEEQNSDPDAHIKNMEIFISSKNAVAAITHDKNLFVIDQSGIPINIGNNIDAVLFSKDGDNLMFNSPFEIFTYNLAIGQKNLITRLSQKISNVSWYSDYNHIWFFANKAIKNIELDSRPTPNIIDFISLPEKPSNILYSDSNSIYYDRKNNGALSLYQVKIEK